MRRIISENKKPNISVFFPCYNDAHSISQLVTDAFVVLKKYAQKYEVIVVNDGSSDHSGDILGSLEKKYKNLKIINHAKNLGYGKALTSGFKAASFEWIFYTDGDGQYSVKELPVLIKLISKDVDFINGIKMARSDPTYRIIIGDLYSFVVRWLFWLPITDVDCDFRLIRKKIIDEIFLESSSGSICIELVKKSERAGARFFQVSVRHFERKWGESQFFQPKRIFFTLMELSILWIKLMIFGKFTVKLL